MKNKIFMYLFIFTLLLVLFMYVNSKNILDNNAGKLESCIATTEKYQDSLSVMTDKIYELAHFNLENNQDSIDYFLRENLEVDELVPFIQNELYKLNEVEGEHPLIPYVASEGKKMLLNTIKMLNHKWIIADFSDGNYWGEIILYYEITPEKELKFKLIDHFLYPLQ